MLNQPKGTAILTRFVGFSPQVPSDAMPTLEDMPTSVSHRAWQVADSCIADITLGIIVAIL
jgi:hypothetical protein